MTIDLKHTPGPWVSAAEKDGFRIYGIAGPQRSLEPSTGVVAIVPFARERNTYRHKAVDECNAHLINAAPTMYRALQVAEHVLTRAHMFGPERDLVRYALVMAAGK